MNLFTIFLFQQPIPVGFWILIHHCNEYRSQLKLNGITRWLLRYSPQARTFPAPIIVDLYKSSKIGGYRSQVHCLFRIIIYSRRISRHKEIYRSLIFFVNERKIIVWWCQCHIGMHGHFIQVLKWKKKYILKF